VLLAQIIVNGILLGGLYGLMALGMALVWGVLNIVNLAHGAFIMLGGYAVYFLFAELGIDPFLALPIAMAVMFAFGYLLQLLVLNQIVRSAMLNTLLITFGLDVVLTYLAQLLFTADFRTIGPSYAGANFTLLGVTVPGIRLAAFAVAWLLAGIMWIILTRLPLGRSIRATAQNLTAARLYGVNPRQLYAVTFGIGAPLTAQSFVIAVIGGLDNPFSVILAGLVIGIAESLAALYLGPTYANVISFGLLVVILVLRPARALRSA
jgi:branched-chain amino acid transport system permease protein